MLISDRDQRLLAADQEVFGDTINRLICCFHLKGNLCKRYSGTVPKFFCPIVNSKTLLEFSSNIESLHRYNCAAADYLIAIDRSMWVTAFYTAPNYGHKTSNIVKSMNKVFKDA
jgi:hypothetical protein